MATVSGTGLVKAVSAGTATITVSAGGKSTSASITVVPVSPVLTQISVSPSTASIEAGQTQSYTAVAYDQFNKPMSGITFTWASDGSTFDCDPQRQRGDRSLAGNRTHHSVRFRRQQRAGIPDGASATIGVDDHRGHSRHAFNFYRREPSNSPLWDMTRVEIR